VLQYPGLRRAGLIGPAGRTEAIFEWYEDEVRRRERQRSEEAVEKPILFYGSSSINYWPALEEDFPGQPILNAGFGGSTLAACVHYFERLVAPAAPRSIVFYAGDNDLGDGQMPDAVLGSLHALQEKVASQLGETPFAFISIKPSVQRFGILDRIVAVNAGARRLLAERPQSFYIDIASPSLQNDGMPRRSLYADDGLHLSPEGYALWAQMIRCFLPRLAEK
jgi:lysophospholipase L1-like esterase